MGGRIIALSCLALALTPSSVLAQAELLDEPVPEVEVDTVFEEPGSEEALVTADVPPPSPDTSRSPQSVVTVPEGYARPAPGPMGAVTARAPAGVVVRTPGRELQIDDDHSRVPRISVMALAGGATMAAAAFGMFELGCAIEGGRGSGGCSVVGWTMGAASALSLTPFTVWLSGQLMDGTGGYGWTLLGTAVGFAAGFLGALAMVAGGETGDPTFVPMMVGPTLGAIIFYEASSDPSRSAIAEAERRAFETTWAPTITATDDGGMVGVVGSF